MKAFLALSTFLITMSSFASGSQPFSEGLFKALSKNPAPVIVGFHADSCGSCKVQKPNFEALLQEEGFKKVTGLMAKFETTSEFRKTLSKSVRSPSTIVVFKNGTEIARIQGTTDKNELRTLLQNAITKN